VSLESLLNLIKIGSLSLSTFVHYLHGVQISISRVVVGFFQY